MHAHSADDALKLAVGQAACPSVAAAAVTEVGRPCEPTRLGPEDATCADIDIEEPARLALRNMRYRTRGIALRVDMYADTCMHAQTRAQAHALD